MNKPYSERTISIFTDAATSSKSVISVGAFLLLEQQHIDEYSEYTPEKLSTKLADMIIYKEYKSKKSTWSEIKTVIDALHLIQINFVIGIKVAIYTDCQSFCDLINRRKDKLIKNNFITKAGKPHPNTELYKELFAITEKFQIKTFKIKGHALTAHRLTVQEKIFAILDKLSRNKLRSILNDRL